MDTRTKMELPMINYQNLYGPRQPQYGQPPTKGPSIPPGEAPNPGFIPPGQGRPSIPPGERPNPGFIPDRSQVQQPPQVPFSQRYAPQMQQAQQFPGFMDRARQQWQQMRQQQGPGFWRQYMDPNQGMQQNMPGFLNMYQQMMGGQPPQRFMNMAQNRGWY